MNNSPKIFTALLAAIVLATGCEADDETRQIDEPVANAAEAAPPASPMAADGQALGPRLEEHMRRARAADAEEFRRMFPEHRDLVNAMLDECREMMRDMGMTPPRQFTRVEEALEEDLQRVPNISDEELSDLKPDHLDRVQRVMDMRNDMMEDMGM